MASPIPVPMEFGGSRTVRSSSLEFAHAWLVVTRELVVIKTAFESSKNVAKRNRCHVVSIIARNRDES